jgi:hypothetical protein
MDESKIGFETFVNTGTHEPTTAKGWKSSKYRIARWLEGLMVEGMSLGS